MRLVGGATSNEGRVEICINQVWGTVCYATSYYNRWDTSEGRVVCRQLGHQELGECNVMKIRQQLIWTLDYAGLTAHRTASSLYGVGSGAVFLSNLYCACSEDNLLQCPHTVFVGTSCTHARDVGLYCERKYCGSFSENYGEVVRVIPVRLFK